MRVFLTGATGFLGGFIAHQLVDAGHTVRALRRDATRGSAVALGVEWVTGDILDRPSVARALDGSEAVIHVAATVGFARAQREAQRLVNVEGTRAVIEAALDAKVKRFVHTSSISALGRPDPRNGEGDENTRYDWPPGMQYHESKRDSEAVALAGSKQGMEVVALSPGGVLGPGDAHLGGFLRAVKRGLVRVAPPGGLTLCDVRDVADAHVAALTRGRSGERYVLGGVHATYRQVAEAFARALGAPAPLATLPPSVLSVLRVPLGLLDQLLPLPVHPANAEQLLVEKYYSSTKAIDELGYRTRALEESVADTVAWYRQKGEV